MPIKDTDTGAQKVLEGSQSKVPLLNAHIQRYKPSSGTPPEGKGREGAHLRVPLFYAQSHRPFKWDPSLGGGAHLRVPPRYRGPVLEGT